MTWPHAIAALLLFAVVPSSAAAQPSSAARSGSTGQPIAGQPVAGQPVAGQPVAGRPIAGQPVAGQPVVAQHGAPAEPQVAIGPAVPAWVEPIDVPEPTEGPGGIETLVHDVQWRVEQGRGTRFVRAVYRIRATSGLEQASELSIEVASGDTLALHHVRRTRGDETLDILSPGSVRVIQPESRLGDGLYDEARRALVFLEDIRVGDVIEYAYSRTEDDTITDGLFAHREHLGAYETRAMRFVASWPESRAVQVRVHDLPEAWRATRAATSVRIEARDIEPEPPGEDTPDWFFGQPWVELTEFSDWRAVATWALPRYTVADPGPALAAVPMDRFRAAAGDAERAVEALRFVQDEVRYLGLEMGERALFPHPPEIVARRRYGDCKDKSLLLATILRALGIEADVALVSSDRGHVLDDELPGPGAFDHVVVRARIDGEDVWMDATRTHERAPLHALPPLLVERALLLRSDTRGLVEVPIPAPDAPDIEIEERFEVQGAEATLRVVTVMRGAQATMMRAELEEEGLESMQERYLQFYEEQELEPHVATPLAVEEIEGGALRWREHYRVSRFWVDGERDVSAWAVGDYVGAPDPERASAPLRVPYPVDVLHRVVVDLDAGWSVPDEEQRIDSRAFELTRRVDVRGSRLTLETHVRTRAGHVAPEDVPQYAQEMERAEELVGFAVTEPGALPRETDPIAGLICLGMIGAVLALAAGSRLVAGRRRRSFQRRQRFEPGESAAHAIPVADRAEAEHAQAGATCCGRPIAGQWTRAQLAGDALFVHAGRCAECGATRRRYYRQARA